MIRHRGLVMLFSDLLGDPESILKAIHRLRFRGHDMIIFHILDEAEAEFPFTGMLRLEDNETNEMLEVDADAIKADYLDEVAKFRETYKQDCIRGANRLCSAAHRGCRSTRSLMSYSAHGAVQ